MTQPSLAFDLTPPPTTRKPSPVEMEIRRLSANAARLLAYLQSHEWATNVEISQPSIAGLRAVGRFDELRKQGWRIEKQHLHGGVWRYRLRGRSR